MQNPLPTRLSRQLAVAEGRAAVRCVQFSGALRGVSGTHAPCSYRWRSATLVRVTFLDCERSLCRALTATAAPNWNPALVLACVPASLCPHVPHPLGPSSLGPGRKEKLTKGSPSAPGERSPGPSMGRRKAPGWLTPVSPSAAHHLDGGFSAGQHSVLKGIEMPLLGVFPGPSAFF